MGNQYTTQLYIGLRLHQKQKYIVKEIKAQMFYTKVYHVHSLMDNGQYKKTILLNLLKYHLLH